LTRHINNKEFNFIIIIIIIIIIITDYFLLLENILDTKNFGVILLGDFSAPGFNGESGSPLPSRHCYYELKGDAVYTSTSLLGLRLCVEGVDIHNLLDLVFTNFSDAKSVIADSGLVKPDTYHPGMSTDVCLPRVNNNVNCEFSNRNFAAGNYTLLYNILSRLFGLACMQPSVDVAIASLSAAVPDVVEQAIPPCHNQVQIPSLVLTYLKLLHG
jgi:hypothetical protein